MGLFITSFLSQPMDFFSRYGIDLEEYQDVPDTGQGQLPVDRCSPVFHNIVKVVWTGSGDIQQIHPLT